MKPENHPLADLLHRLQEPDGWSVVEAWAAERETETNHLEFKRKTNPTTPELDPKHKDSDNIAKSISALANTGGGLLVLGVDAGGGDAAAASFDRVKKIEAIARVDELGGYLEHNVRSFTDPVLLGTKVATVKRPGTDEGVVVVSVSDVPGGPYRAMHASGQVNDRYYMRTAAGSITVPHPLLSALFAFGGLPRLRLGVRGIGDTRHELVLQNDGRTHVSHVAVYVRLTDMLGGRFNFDGVTFGWDGQGMHNERALFACGPRAIYPGQVDRVGVFLAPTDRVNVSATIFGAGARVDFESGFRAPLSRRDEVWFDAVEGGAS